MYLQPPSRFTPTLLLLLALPAQADTNAASVPSRGDAIAKGDRIIFNADAPIFTLDPNAATDPKNPTKACVPSRSQIEIESAPKTTTSTEATSSSGKPLSTTTKVSGAVTVSETAAAPAGDTVTTKTTSATTATARIVRVGPSKLGRAVYKLFGIGGPPYEVDSGMTVKDSKGNSVKVMVPGCRQVPKNMQPTVIEGATYSFTPSDLDGYSTARFGLTYGVVVVPNKVIIANRSFISSSSVLPYIGYEAWGPGVAGAIVFAAGVGTAPASSQASSTTATSPGTKATFSVATGMIGSIAGVFKVGVLVGVDTQGKNSGFQYQGKPWIGISLGAGTQ